MLTPEENKKNGETDEELESQNERTNADFDPHKILW